MRITPTWGEKDRGSAVNVQVAILFPLLLLTVFTVLQTGLYLYGKDVALSAARAGVDQGRAFGVTDTGAAQARAQTALASSAGGVLDSPRVTATRTGTTMTVTVDAAVTSLVPGLDMRVSQSSTAALELVTR